MGFMKKRYIKFCAWLEDDKRFEEKFSVYRGDTRDNELGVALDDWMHEIFDSHEYDLADGFWEEIGKEEYEAATSEEYVD